MTKKAHLIKASVLNNHSAEKSGALLFVYASTDRSINKKAEFASFKCGKCNTEFAALKGTEPYCVTCGTEDVYEDEGQQLDTETYENPDKELASISCSSCNTQNIVKLETASVFGSVMHCVTCGTSIDFQSPIVSNTDEDGNELQDSFDDTLEGADTDVDFTESETLEEPEEETTETTSEEEVETPEGETTNEENTDTTDNGETVAEEETNTEETPEGTESTEETPEEENESDDDDYEDFEEETLAKLMGNGSFTLDRVSDIIVASVNSIPIATLAKEDAGDNSKHFFAPEFASAIKHTVKQLGIEKGLENYQFSFAKVKIPVKDIISKRVNAGLQKEVASVNSKLETLTADFEQCFGIALSALNKGFFKNKSNPLKEGFVAHLTTAGIRSPSKIVDNVFKTYGKDMNLAAFELAKDLMSKSVEFRNELAESIGESNYQETDNEDASSDEDTLESRLEGAGLKPRVETSKTNEVKSQKSFTVNKGQDSMVVSSAVEKARKLSGTGSIFLKR